MPRNGWIACIIILIIMLCISVFCLLAGLLGIAGYLTISPTISWNNPFSPSLAGTITPSPVVVRPTLVSPLTTVTPDSIGPTPVYGSEFQYVLVPTDTLRTLEDTFIPINNPIELAQRLLSLENLSPTVAPPEQPYTLGSKMSFWVLNGDDKNIRVQATLEYLTDHAYFWIENGTSFDRDKLRTLADTFENQIYPTDRAFFGSEWTPGVDGDPHIYILYAQGIGDGIAGYFLPADEYPTEVNQYSNVHEMFLFNADNSPLDDRYTFGVLAHELQHMIHWYQDQNEANWIGEGFSELAVFLNGFYDGGFDALYTSNPDLQLNDLPDETKEDYSPHYGASFLFLKYFLDRFGESATKALVANQDNDLEGVDSTLRQLNATDPASGQSITADDFFLDWAITNYVMDADVADGRYSYYGYNGTPPVSPNQSFSRCPVDRVTESVHQYGVDYIRFRCPGSYILHFEGSIQTPLLPADPHSGRYAMWANKNDESDTMLTKTFDLTKQTGPITLNYFTWYDIEAGWDYLYVEASLDGENWEILKPPNSTNDDPRGANYGWGYTGYSGRKAFPVWIQESIDLSRFGGKTLTLRFEYMTDSNITGEGFLLDDISIPEIGYSADFEMDSGGWQADGWARIQNVLPQTYRLALISEGDQTQVSIITLNPDMTADIPFTINAAINDVILVVSGTTRFTRQLAPYRFSVNQP